MLLSMGTKTVILSSIELPSNGNKLVLLAKNTSGELKFYTNSITTVVPCVESLCTYPGERARVEIPKLAARFTGTGDLFAALILAWGHEPLQVQSIVSLLPCRVTISASLHT